MHQDQDHQSQSTTSSKRAAGKGVVQQIKLNGNGHSQTADLALLAQERVLTFEAVPADLRARDQWVVYKVRPKRDKRGRIIKGKSDKVPFNPRTGAPASTADSATWSGFDDAVSAYEAAGGVYAGIGFVFTKDDAFVGVDFDECRDKERGTLLAWAAEFLAAFATYAEISPSETGIHLIGRAAGGRGRRQPEGLPRRSDREIRLWQILHGDGQAGAGNTHDDQ